MTVDRPKPEDVLSNIMLTVFRINAELLVKGDQLVAPIGITSARWQVLGAIALVETPLSCPQIASSMGITRQGALKQLNLMLEEKIVYQIPNPKNERSPLYDLTKKGKKIFNCVARLNVRWTKSLVKGLDPAILISAFETMSEVESRLKTTTLPIEK